MRQILATVLPLMLFGCSEGTSFHPLADAGNDQVVAIGETVNLDASSSSDPDGEVSSFAWTLVSTPSSSGAALANQSESATSITPDSAGSYVVTLSVWDDQNNESMPDVVTITAVEVNERPVADLTVTGDLGPGLELVLDGSDSYDAEGTPLEYAFEVLVAPQGSQAIAVPSPEPSVATFTPDREGYYVVGLTVNDGDLSSVRTDRGLTVSSQVNASPEAICAAGKTVDLGVDVTLDGTPSYDPEGQALTYSWTFTAPEGSAADLDDASSATPSFNADTEGTYVGTLTVNDGVLDSASCDQVVQAGKGIGNEAPVADAGPDQTVTEGNAVTLNGTNSADPDGDPLTYSWTFVSIPADSALDSSDINDFESDTAGFTPDVIGEYTVALEVSDGALIDTDTAIITIGANEAPVADAGQNQSVYVAESVTLDGSASYDPNGDALTFSWSFVSTPSGSSATFDDATATTPVFVADAEGTFVVELTVSDGLAEDSAEVRITASEKGGNLAPVADAGSDDTLTLGATAVLDGSASYDPDGDALTYSWAFDSVPADSALSDSDIGASSSDVGGFTPDVVGEYVLTLDVSDGSLTDSDTVVVTVEEEAGTNTDPVADAGANQTVILGAVATLDGSESYDPDGDALTYAWSFVGLPSGSAVDTSSLDSSTSATPSFTPDVVGDYTLALTVSDGLATSTDETVVTAYEKGSNTPPVADAGDDLEIELGNSASPDGSGSTDADGDTLTYAWSFASMPADSTLTDADINDADTEYPSFSADVAGEYELVLTVSDGSATNSDSVLVTVTAANTDPVADAGADQTITLGDTAVTDGSGSTDADGDALTYTWTIDSVPSGSSVDDDALTGATTVNAIFVPDVAGEYVLTLTVSDGSTTSTDSVTFTVEETSSNTAPVADAGPDQEVDLDGALVALDGSGSSDADGDTLTYSWSFSSLPSGSSLLDSDLADSGTDAPSFTPDVAGDYEVTLTVSDGSDADSDSVVITVNEVTTNTPPVADAGTDATYELGETVSLDGTGSYDPDGDAITYSWAVDSVPSDSGMDDEDLVDADTDSATFTPDVAGVYTFVLTVSDGTESDSDRVTITVEEGATTNTPPVADAGTDTTYELGETVTLDGTGSYDADGDALTYSWAVDSVPSDSGMDDGDLVDADTDSATFTPDVEGEYVLTLTVSDGTDTDTDTVVITVEDTTVTNTPPVADAGPDQTVELGDTVALDGTGSSDADGDALTYSWTLDSAPSDSGMDDEDLVDADTDSATFTPDVEGEYVLTLTVSDGTDSSTDTVTITVEDTTVANNPPVADAGEDQIITLGDTATLDGSASYDDDGDALTYSWAFDSVPSGSSLTDSDIVDGDTEYPTFTADAAGDYTLSLTVSDGTDSSTDDVLVVVDDPATNSDPVADAGEDFSAYTGETVTLDGTGSYDSDGDAITYTWSTYSVPSGSSIVNSSLDDNNSATPSFVPDVAGDYTWRLVVSDGTATDKDYVTITVDESTSTNTPPVADAGADQTIELGDTATLDGSGSSDADGDALTYSWVMTSLPSGSVPSLTDADTDSPLFTPDLEGEYVLTLTVSDGTDSSTDTVTITVEDTTVANTPPVADAGEDQVITLGDTASLDGSGSSDADGDALTYSWSFTGVPSGSSLDDSDISDSDTDAPTFTADAAGDYELTLTVSDGTDSSTDTVLIVVDDPATNSDPVADAGADQTVELGGTVTLDATGSYDSDGDAITYTWSTYSVPSGSSIVNSSLDDNNAATPSFDPDVVGDYTWRLVVSDGTATDKDYVTITVEESTSTNNPPVADAGADQNVYTGETVALDGSDSSDADGDALTYSWSFTSVPSGSSLDDSDISNSGTSAPSFSPDVEGDYELTLTVSDGTDTDSDSVTVAAEEASTGNTPPVADAGFDQTVEIDDTVTLDGSGSYDEDGDALSYSWVLTSWPDACDDSDASSDDADGDGSDNCEDYSIYDEAFDGSSFPWDELDVGGSNSPDWDLTGDYLYEESNAARTVMYSDDLGELSAFDISVDILHGGDLNNNAGIVFGGDSSGSYYLVDWYDPNGSYGTGGEIRLFQCDAGELATDFYGNPIDCDVLANDVVSDVNVPIGAWATLAASIDGEDVVVTLDGEEVLYVTVTDAPLGPRIVGLYSYDNDGGVYYDNFTITNPEVPSLVDEGLSGSGDVTTTFTAEVLGDYVFTLTVGDGTDTDSDTVTITVTDDVDNTDPVADAGADQTVEVGETVDLDGSGSYDDDGDTLEYRWTFSAVPGGSALFDGDLSDGTTTTPYFVPDLEGEYEISLLVSDGYTTVTDTLIVTVEAASANTEPVADAGADQTATTGDTVTLDGTGSYDDDGDALTYTWSTYSVPSSSSVTSGSLNDTTAATPAFTPDVAGEYIWRLVVSDGVSGSDTDYVTIVVEEAATNTAPVADAGADATYDLGDTVTLDGSGSSDADGDALAYGWTFTTVPSGSSLADGDIADSGTDTASFTPDVAGEYEIALTVNDGTDSDTDSVTITVEEVVTNTDPVADAGADQTATTGDTVTLDATGSYDPDGDAITYTWSTYSLPSSSSVTTSSLDDNNSATPSFTPDVAGDYTWRLVVSDGTVNDKDYVTITVEEGATNTAPVADAGSDASYDLGETVMLDGSGSYDDDGDALAYGWTFTSVPSGSSIADSDMTDSDTNMPSFTPDVAGDYEVSLTVNDGTDSDSDSVTITVEEVDTNTDPVADAGTDQSAVTGDTVTLDATGSYDDDGDALTYTWSTYSLPSSSSVTTSSLDDNNSATPSFTPDVAGDYTWRLVVSDGTATDKDYVTITVEEAATNTDPVADAGSDQSAFTGDTVALDATGSYDDDGDALTYTWSVYSVPSSSSVTASSLDDNTSETPSFTPDVAGDYTWRLVVSDGTATDKDYVTITVEESSTEPVADAGSDQDLCAVDEVTLDGSGSYDSNGDALTYTWSFDSVPSESALTDSDIDDSDQDTAYFTPDAEGTYTITLTVDDGTDTSADTVTVDLDQGGVVLAMLFDEGSGTAAADSSGRGHEGAVSVANWSSGYLNGGMAFDGSTAVTVDDSAGELSPSTDYTLEWWMKTSSTDQYYGTVLHKPDSSGVYGYAVWLYYGSIAFYGYESVSSYNYHQTDYSAYTDDNQWHHYAIVLDSSNGFTLYIDGDVYYESADSSSYIEANGDLHIGHYGSSYYLSDAVVDEVLIRNTPLSASEVEDRYESGSQWCTEWTDSTNPDVNIDSPSSGTSMDSPYVTVTGTSSDDSDVSTVAVTVNGDSYDVSTDDGYATWTVYLPLDEGSNTVTATATDLFGNTSSDSITVSYSDSCIDGVDVLYTFDEYEGSTVADRSDNALDMRVIGADRVATVELGNVLRFDGSNDYAYVEDDPLVEPTGEFTVDFWFMRDGGSPSWECMLQKGYNWGTYSVWIYDNTIYVGMQDADGASYYTYTSGYFDGDYHHVALVYDGNDGTVYIDGAYLDSFEVGPDLYEDDLDLRLGNDVYSTSGYHFDGDIGQFRIHDTALTSGEVLDLTDEQEACQISENYATSGTATANTEYGTAYGANNINDGNVAEDGSSYSYWLTEVGVNGYATLILDDIIGVSEVRFLNTRGGGYCAHAEYSIYASTTGAFAGEEVVIDTGDGELEDTPAWKTVTLDSPVEAQFVRFVSEDYDGYCGGLNELEIYGVE